jgi:dihydrofolate reductase
MGELALVEFVTLDGVMQGFAGPDEDGGFRHGGWGAPYQHPAIFEAGVQGPGAAAYLFGRRTYEGMVAFWPHQPDDNVMAARLNRAPKYVATRTLDELEWSNARRLEGELVPAVAELKASIDGGIVLLGSGQVAQQLLLADLVDRLTLFVHPLVLGAGRRLFPTADHPLRFELEESRSVPTGVLVLNYASVNPRRMA